MGDGHLVAGISSATYYFSAELDASGHLTKSIVMVLTTTNVPAVGDWAQFTFSSAPSKYEDYLGKIEWLAGD